MKELLVAATCSLAISMFAQSPIAQAKAVAEQACVEESLQEDGICLVTAPDGSFQIFTRGSGTYQFVNPRAEANARKVARANAIKNLTAFLYGQKVKGEDSLETLQKNSLKMTGDGQVQDTHAAMEDLETVAGTIKSSTEGIINGLVVVESRKVPTAGTTGGTIQVTMVYSAKTAKASSWAGKNMQNHQADLKVNEAQNEARVNAARQKAREAASAEPAAVAPVMPPAAAPAAAPAGSVPANQSERRVNKTEY